MRPDSEFESKLEAVLNRIAAGVYEAKAMLQARRPAATIGPPGTTTPGSLSLEIDGTTGSPQPPGSDGDLKITNATGENLIVGLLAGTAQAGQVAVVIPDGGSASVKRTPNQAVSAEFVRYETYDPCDPFPQIGVPCITQLYRLPANPTGTSETNDGVPSSNFKFDTFVHEYTFKKNAFGGFSLT